MYNFLTYVYDNLKYIVLILLMKNLYILAYAERVVKANFLANAVQIEY